MGGMGEPSAPASQVQVTLEEQRLENGVLNGFYTEVDQAVTGADGVVELTTMRSNVLSIRLRVAREGCFEELMPFNPEDLTSGETLNHHEVAVMPQTRVDASLSNTLPECTNSNMIYRWIPRDVEGAASEVRWSCGTDWVAVEGAAPTSPHVSSPETPGCSITAIGRARIGQHSHRFRVVPAGEVVSGTSKAPHDV